MKVLNYVDCLRVWVEKKAYFDYTHYHQAKADKSTRIFHSENQRITRTCRPMAHKLTADWYSSMLVFTTH